MNESINNVMTSAQKMKRCWNQNMIPLYSCSEPAMIPAASSGETTE